MPDPADNRTDPDRPGPRYDDYDRERPRSGGPSGLMIGLIIGAIVIILLCVVFGIGGALLLPAVQKVREAASRAKEQNNMKQIALAFHNDVDVNGRGFYAPYAHDQKMAVKTGLSHRVSLLPYLEQDMLYRQFDLDQPWDSGANRTPANTVVVTYTTPNEAPTVNTPFRSFFGGGALFNEDGSPVRFTDVTDGTANTILFVHARDQVPWAQPKEFGFVNGMLLPQLGHPAQPNGFNAAMVDGSVRFVSSSVSPASLRAAITRSGGETPGTDW